MTEANTWDFPWFSETVPATEFSTNPVTVLVMTVGFSEDSIDGIDGSAAVEIAGGFEDILAVGEIEAGKFDENTDVKAEGMGILVGLSCWLSDLVNELKLEKMTLTIDIASSRSPSRLEQVTSVKQDDINQVHALTHYQPNHSRIKFFTMVCKRSKFGV